MRPSGDRRGPPAGLAAALTAGRAGAQVILADEDFRLGGRLLAEVAPLCDTSGTDWVSQVQAELGSLPNVRVMSRTTVFGGAYDHGIYGAVERNADHLPAPAADKPRQTLWRIYSKRALVATGGAIERPIAFENNDRPPGVMLAGGAPAPMQTAGPPHPRALSWSSLTTTTRTRPPAT